MRKALALLISAMLLFSPAMADSRAAVLNGRLFLSLEEDADGEAIVRDGRTITHLQAVDGALYYVAEEDVDEDRHNEILTRMDADGNSVVIGEARLCGAEYTYTEDYSRLTDYYYHPGYGDMKVYGGHIYFIGANGVPGSYFTSADGWGGYSGDYETRCESTSSLYRMDPDGNNLTELIGNLGNGECHFDIQNDVIAVSTCWRNGIYAYDFSDFALYDLGGGLIREIENSTESRHSWIYKKDCEFTCIVVDIRTDGERIYASLGDSEGDFASARLTDMDHPDETLFYEAFYVPSLLTEDGFIALASAAEDEFYFDGMENTLSLQLISPEGVELLACVPADFGGYGETRLSLADGMVYLTSGSRAIRVPVSGGRVEEWTGGGFARADAFNSANYPR